MTPACQWLHVGALYDQFWFGARGQYPDFTEAVKRHREIEAVFKSSDEGQRIDLNMGK